MFEGVSEIAGRVAQLQSALESYDPPSPTDASGQPSFQQTLQTARSGASTDSASSAASSTSGPAGLRPTVLTPSQLGSSAFSVGTSGASQLPASASSLGAMGGMAGLSSLGIGGGTSGLGAGSLGLLSGLGASGTDMSGLLGSTDPTGLGGLGSSDPTGMGSLLGSSNATGLGGLGSSDPTGLGGLLGSSNATGLGGLLGSSNAPGLGGLLGSGGSAGLGSLLGSSGMAYGAQSGSIANALSSGGAGSQQAGIIANALSSGGAGSQQAGMAGLVGQIAQSQGVNPALAQAVAQSESGFNPQAVSPAGAQGLMQLMPGTFQQYAAPTDLPSGVPVAGATVSQPFGPTTFSSEPPLQWNGTQYSHFHTGIDLAVPQGTPIRATIGGTVEIRSDPEGFGNLVVVRSGPWDVLYGHTSSHPTNIQTGSVVKPGDVIGFTGSTGNSTGPHVHYEVRYNGQILDPTPFLKSAATTANPMDPVANAKAGVGYLKDMLGRFNNNVPAALAAYNAGPAAVAKYGGVPPYPETQNYVQKTIQNAQSRSA